MPQSGDGDLSQSKPIWAPIGGGELTNTNVVCTNESEYNHSTTFLMTLARACQKTAVLWLRTYVLVLVLTYSPEYSLPQSRKLLVFGNAPNQLVGTHASPCNAPHQYPIGR